MLSVPFVVVTAGFWQGSGGVDVVGGGGGGTGNVLRMQLGWWCCCPAIEMQLFENDGRWRGGIINHVVFWLVREGLGMRLPFSSRLCKSFKS